MTYLLLTGTQAAARLPGWVTTAQDEPSAAHVWWAHRDALVAEAAAAGFVPWMVAKKKPQGEAVERWQQQFLGEHAY